MIRNYELTYLAEPELSEEDLKTFCDKIGGFVSETAGVIENQPNPLKKRLAYPIKRKKEAFLLTIVFKTDAGNFEKIEKKLKAESGILRFIIIAKKPLKKLRRKFPARSPENILEKEKKEERQGIYESQKVELKEIDKKIEEILNQ